MFNLVPILTPILQDRFAFKHPGFREEREWRLFREQVGNFDEDAGENEPFFNGAFHAVRRPASAGRFSLCGNMKGLVRL